MFNKAINIIFCWLLMHANGYSSEVDTISVAKGTPAPQISVELGIHRSPIGDKVYIGTPTKNCECFAYWGFYAYPTTGFQFNILYDKPIHEKFLLRSGLSVFSRPERYESNVEKINEIQDKYHVLVFSPDSDVIAFKISRTNFEVPFSLGFIKGNFEALLGIRVFLLSYTSSSLKFLDGEERVSGSWSVFTERFVNHFVDGDMSDPLIYWEARFYYAFHLRSIEVKSFVGLDVERMSFWYYSYHLQTGINIPLWTRK